ncbi:hypothetical protein VNO78_30437 [Psophocarpus tetragonolobus]|uniref:Uncharacterized protein n=1 Tax=Psophocarpus tetragonolobus TaxID=3891 RepID=A0AAN9X6M6_PSOTE
MGTCYNVAAASPLWVVSPTRTKTPDCSGSRSGPMGRAYLESNPDLHNVFDGVPYMSLHSKTWDTLGVSVDDGFVLLDRVVDVGFGLLDGIVDDGFGLLRRVVVDDGFGLLNGVASYGVGLLNGVVDDGFGLLCLAFLAAIEGLFACLNGVTLEVWVDNGFGLLDKVVDDAFSPFDGVVDNDFGLLDGVASTLA